MIKCALVEGLLPLNVSRLVVSSSYIQEGPVGIKKIKLLFFSLLSWEKKYKIWMWPSTQKHQLVFGTLQSEIFAILKIDNKIFFHLSTFIIQRASQKSPYCIRILKRKENQFNIRHRKYQFFNLLLAAQMKFR